jgi:hypothetical protein
VGGDPVAIANLDRDTDKMVEWCQYNFRAPDLGDYFVFSAAGTLVGAPLGGALASLTA